MKELSEYKNEIFRRSDAKKQKIKKHRRIALGVAVPLCLCCVLMAVFPPGGFASKDVAAAPEGIYDNNAMDDVNCAPGETLGNSGSMEDVADTAPCFQFTAQVVEYSQGWVLVEPLDGEPERSSSDRISFSTQNLEPLEVQVGTLVVITYGGEIMETYPAQISPISWRIVS